MTDFDPQDPDYETRVRASFKRQRVMETIGAELMKIAPGEVEIALPFRADLTQQNGYLHAGIVAAIVDSACGYAAMSLTPAGGEVLSIEFKLNLLSPAAGESFVARGRVKRAGRNVTVCTGDLFALYGDGAEKLVATMLATMMNVRERA
ncbi:MAG TPA: PaaI family thioesterase [Pyrinomonadaceae bacterium]|nr:PaaI family thioesterase [Pyrinomonadaceae bacterium]